MNGITLSEEERGAAVKSAQFIKHWAPGPDLKGAADRIIALLTRDQPPSRLDWDEQGKPITRDQPPEVCEWSEHPDFEEYFHPGCVSDEALFYPRPLDATHCAYCGLPIKETT
jgi:YD repeat-containing protein